MEPTSSRRESNPIQKESSDVYNPSTSEYIQGSCPICRIGIVQRKFTKNNVPSVDQIVTANVVEMATETNSLATIEDKDSDEESFYLPLDDDESYTIRQGSINAVSDSENNEDQLSKLDSTSTSEIERQLENLLNGEQERAEGDDKPVDDSTKAPSTDEDNDKATNLTTEDPDASEANTDSERAETAGNKVAETPSNHNEDIGELFDISIIRDVAEDNAENALDEEAQRHLLNEETFNFEDVGETDNARSEAEDDEISELRVNGDNHAKAASNLKHPQTKDVLVNGPKDTTFLTELVDPEKNAVENRKSLKRLLSVQEEVCNEDEAKKFKADTVKAATMVEKPSLRSLFSLVDFMKLQTSKMTVRDLEGFCAQKICEVLVHHSQIGDVKRQLELQEQQIDSMHKEVQQLTKQCKDLQTVNKQLLKDLRQRNNKKMNPLKITRSVGLQVKMVASDEPVPKRKTIRTTSKKVAAQSPPTVNPDKIPQYTITPISIQMAQPEQVVPRRKSTEGVASSQSQQTTRLEIIVPTPSATSVIDLTEENDTPGTKIGPFKTPVRVQNAQGLTFSTAQTTGKNATITTSPHQQLMYVVHSSALNVHNSQLGSKAVVLQAAKNILTSTQVGLAVLALPKKSAVQLKAQHTSPTSTVGNTGNIIHSNNNNNVIKLSAAKHPAPLPAPSATTRVRQSSLKPILPKPVLTVRKSARRIILQWKMPYDLDLYEAIASYQLYAYQESSALPSTEMWRRVGDVKALSLPMLCTLTQFAAKNKYYFAVRPVDIYKRIGFFSDPEEIFMN